MIWRCDEDEFDAILEIINDAARAYEGVIPADCWRDPYMPESELRHEIDNGVTFCGLYEKRDLIGVMGIQDVGDVTLIRHAYVRTSRRREGIGSHLLSRLRRESSRPYLVGTWAAATWAMRFYERNGFQLLSRDEATSLLRNYWSIPERQIETSVVLADDRWCKKRETQEYGGITGGS
ncbi:MAG: GNAT family N-acetyltransferase [Candidatus Neomarinimicrobiota bacterium]